MEGRFSPSSTKSFKITTRKNFSPKVRELAEFLNALLIEDPLNSVKTTSSSPSSNLTPILLLENLQNFNR